ncbi:MAG: SAM-dependent methyltransferase [Bacteroidales bacterium]|jgi:hypothetical protein|nr:SAM-dependent methyltransferase [Bacteroidales bacterium]MCI2133950.1 SAM-dependent methyltransferase [Bacteroidales bacterium]
MALSKRQFIQYLKEADFRTLFIEEMGWNKYNATIADIPTFYVGDKSFDIKTIAHRNGFQILQCFVEELPSNSVCKKLDTKLRKAANDYICIFVVSGTEHHEWVAPVKTNEKRDIVIIEYAEAEKAEFLYEKISGLSFDIDEVTTIVDVKARVQGTFAINSEKITKDFYSGFAKEHKSFAGFIIGIDDQIATKDNKNKQWYTSVMLNRLMFCYFIQKKGFLNGDENYLRNKLRWVQEKKGNNKFFKSFYKGFLVQLFRGGLNSPTHDEAFEDIYGRIPYLNGGMFDVHQIERDYEGIDIKDEAFESLFEFFDKWRWHLDTRVTASGRDINPDVLGYIFEQYINDRAQMGAYYTKEDITEYIGRNTIIPYLFDATSKKYPEAFKPEGEFWLFFKERGDEFIYDAVKKGAGQTIPDEIACGIDTEAPDLLERRKLWNNTTPDNIGLPTEIWRETIERLQRYQDVKNKIESGEICVINDFITYNLNIPKIAYDFLNSTEDKKFIEVFYAELRKVTILDPTCGSGAFLFAALNLLEPLYEVCISRMEEFNAQDRSCFNEQLSEIQNKYRSNIQYFIYKSIILRNLYGVDIMAEAVEIAKLRLFLKMVAVVDVDKRAENMGLDPLPDIDFNIRCGNTLIGYANEHSIELDLYGANANLFLAQESAERIAGQLKLVSEAYCRFRDEQLKAGDSVHAYKNAKEQLSKALTNLNIELNRHMFKASGSGSYDEWIKKHQPFHWISEFYQIITENGGFDVIIGNPPYVSISKIDYLSLSDDFKSGDLYGYVIRRVYDILCSKGRHGFIVMHSLAFSGNYCDVRRIIKTKSNSAWFSFYGRIPAGLFSGNVRVRNAIYLTAPSGNNYFTSRMHRWFSEQRPTLFNTLKYNSFLWTDEIPRLYDASLQSVYENKRGQHISLYESKMGKSLIYKKVAYNWLSVSHIEPPAQDLLGTQIPQSSSSIGIMRIDKQYYEIILLLCSGKLYMSKWLTYGDDFHLMEKDLSNFVFPFASITDEDIMALHQIYCEFTKELPNTVQFKLNAGIRVGTFNTKSLWHITDKSDMIFYKYLSDRPILLKELIENHLSVSILTDKGNETFDEE